MHLYIEFLLTLFIKQIIIKNFSFIIPLILNAATCIIMNLNFYVAFILFWINLLFILSFAYCLWFIITNKPLNTSMLAPLLGIFAGIFLSSAFAGIIHLEPNLENILRDTTERVERNTKWSNDLIKDIKR